MKNIVLIGMPGCGKTSLGLRLQKKLCRPLLDTDDMIVAKEGRSIPRIFEEDGEAYFRKVEHECVVEASKGQGQIIATGGGVILNPENMAALKETGVLFFLDVTPESIQRRRTTLSGRPLLQQEDGKQAGEKLRKLYHDRIELYCRYADFRFSNRCHAKRNLLRIVNTMKRIEKGK
jgi:shikimate kinase